MRYSKILHGFFTKSRHFGLSVITASQKYNALAPIARLNTSSLYMFKLKNMAEVDAFVQEQSAALNRFLGPGEHVQVLLPTAQKNVFGSCPHSFQIVLTFDFQAAVA